MTIRQLLNAQHPHPDAEFKVDGAEVTQVRGPQLLLQDLDALIDGGHDKDDEEEEEEDGTDRSAG